MHRAAAEWVEVSRLNKERRGYLDRWVYEECGYDRPSGRLT
jgi:hypothetical protein